MNAFNGRTLMNNVHRCFLQQSNKSTKKNGACSYYYDYMKNKNSTNLSLYNRHYSTSTSFSSSSSSVSSSQPQYRVATITKTGEVSQSTLCITQVLKRVHARDLFSLALTSAQDAQRHSSGSGSGNGNPFQSSRQKRSPTAILPRQDDIIVSFGSIRAVISSDEGILFDAHKPTIQLLAHDIGLTFELHSSACASASTSNDTSTTSSGSNPINFIQKESEQESQIFTYNEPNLHRAGDAFELIFLEEILREVCVTYGRRLQLYEPIVDTVVTRVSNEMHAASGVHRLVPVKDSLQDFEMQVKSALTCLTDLLDDDEDMLGLLLTEKKEAKRLGKNIDYVRHESVELLLEEYSRQLAIVLEETRFLLKKVQSKQELVSISLAAFRNRMIRMNLYLSIGAVGIASSTATAGYFGMNLTHGFEESPTAFWNVVGGASFAGLLFVGGCAAYIHGTASNSRTMARLREIEVLDGVLSPAKMGALDYTMKILAEKKIEMNKTEFQDSMVDSEQFEIISEKEVDLLFGALDISKDGFLSTSDFRIMASLGRNLPPIKGGDDEMKKH